MWRSISGSSCLCACEVIATVAILGRKIAVGAIGRYVKIYLLSFRCRDRQMGGEGFYCWFLGNGVFLW